MKFKDILFAGLAIITFSACSDLSDIYDEIDAGYNGRVKIDVEYTLIAADYNSISSAARLDATTEEEIQDALNILEGDTALTDGYNVSYIPSLIGEKTAYQGFGPKSRVAVTYKFRQSVSDATKDTTQTFYKRSVNAWMLMPDAGLFYDFEDGTDYEEVNLNGWAQYANGGIEDRKFVYRSYAGNRYAQITAFSSAGVLEDKVDMWLVSPALNLDDVYVAKNVQFLTSNAYPNGAQLIPYVMDAQNPSEATVVEELEDAVIADDTKNNYVFVNSGVIDLSDYSGTVYIAFRYLAEPEQTTTFQIDDFEFDFLEMEN